MKNRPSARLGRKQKPFDEHARQRGNKRSAKDSSRPPNAGRTRAVRSDGRGRPEFSAKYRREARRTRKSQCSGRAFAPGESRLRIERFICANKLRASSNNLREAGPAPIFVDILDMGSGAVRRLPQPFRNKIMSSIDYQEATT